MEAGHTQQGSAPPSGGHRPSQEEYLFVGFDQIDQDLKCPLCLLVMRDPVGVCLEGHSFCSECAARDAASRRCPICRGAKVGQPVRNLTLRKLIGSLDVRCPNAVRGSGHAVASAWGQDPPGGGEPRALCGWSGQLSELDSHLKTNCALRSISPSSGGGFAAGGADWFAAGEPEAACPAPHEHDGACPAAAAHTPVCAQTLQGLEDPVAAAVGARRRRRPWEDDMQDGGGVMLYVRSVGHLRERVGCVAGPAAASCLDFGACGLLGAEGAEELAGLLHGCKHVRRVVLRGAGLGARGARALAGALASMAGLTDLDVGGNDLRDEGVAALAEAPGLMKRLRALGLERNGVGDGGAGALAAALQGGAALESLELGANEIGDEGARALAGALPATLRVLGLRENAVGEGGAAALVAALRVGGARELTSLRLQGNLIGGPAALSLLCEAPRAASTDLYTYLY